MKKYCTRCGHEFEAVGREVICPSCKAQAAEDAKRAAVLKAKRASWTGESVPVRISGRASTIIREFSKAHDVPFQEALDALLKASSFFQAMSKAWEEVEPYRSHRRDKAAADKQAAEFLHNKQDETGRQEVKTAAKVSKPATAAKKAVKKAASKAAAGKGGEKA